jgi:hypothetical protein
MANRSFFWGTDAQIYTGSNHFSSLITQSPTLYGLTQQAAQAYSVVNANYASAYVASVSPDTRGRSKTLAKNAAREALRDMAADLAKIIDGTSTVTDQMKFDLGLSVSGSRHPVPVPGEEPNLIVDAVAANRVSVSVKPISGKRRGKPVNVAGVKFFSYVGEEPTNNIQQWTEQGSTSKAKFEIVFPLSLEPFTKVWLSACWLNAKFATGPACTPLAVNLGSWVVQNTANQQADLKAA